MRPQSQSVECKPAFERFHFELKVRINFDEANRW
jgi:hypothetical protein